MLKKVNGKTVEILVDYINPVCGIEKFAEWGLVK